MLAHYPKAVGLHEAPWIDLLEPTDAERGEVERVTGLRLPTREAIAEIEPSSRAYAEGSTLYFSSPVLIGSDCLKEDALTTIGFVLTPERLVTLRYAQIAALDKLGTSTGQRRLGVTDTFLRILEAMVEHAADALEHASSELARISKAAFHNDPPRARSPGHASVELHAALRKLGRMTDGISRIRDTLLGIGRIVAFVMESGDDEHPVPASPRLEIIRTDITSLNDYQGHLASKVQFLLDATLGFVSIQQNDIVKTLTVVSVVGVPPVIIAGIYGMNFEHMPELAWPLGYPFALGLIVVSALAPLVWFKWRGWM